MPALWANPVSAKGTPLQYNQQDDQYERAGKGPEQPPELGSLAEHGQTEYKRNQQSQRDPAAPAGGSPFCCLVDRVTVTGF